MELDETFTTFVSYDYYDLRALCRTYKRQAFDHALPPQELALLLRPKAGDKALKLAVEIQTKFEFMALTARKGAIDAIGFILGIIVISGCLAAQKVELAFHAVDHLECENIKREELLVALRSLSKALIVMTGQGGTLPPTEERTTTVLMQMLDRGLGLPQSASITSSLLERMLLMGMNHLDNPTFGEGSEITIYDIFTTFCAPEEPETFRKHYAVSPWNPGHRRRKMAEAAAIAFVADAHAKQYYEQPPIYFLKGEDAAIFYDVDEASASEDDEDAAEGGEPKNRWFCEKVVDNWPCGQANVLLQTECVRCNPAPAWWAQQGLDAPPIH